jgi:hypothetical protein
LSNSSLSIEYLVVQDQFSMFNKKWK